MKHPENLQRGDRIRVTDIWDGVADPPLEGTVDRIIEHDDGYVSVACVEWAAPFTIMIPNKGFTRNFELIAPALSGDAPGTDGS